jgi:very-short-patch-repair endonuclease
MTEKSAPPDSRVAMIAARQHSVISIRQLRGAGLSDDAVLGRARAGRLYRLHRGVYAVGHRGLTFEGRGMAAVIAIGNDAVLSHRSAAVLWGMLPVIGGPIDVSVAARGGRCKRSGIRVHRCGTLRPGDRSSHRRIPVTTPARTVSDLRRVVSPPEMRRAIRSAEAGGLALGHAPASDRTRSELEYLFLRLCRRNRLPRPEVNARLGSLIVDFLWRSKRLIVETDGYRYHRGRAAFEEDRARDLELRALGFEVIRLSYRQVTEEPRQVAATLRVALEGGREPPAPGLRGRASWR